mgnify:FL=1
MKYKDDFFDYITYEKKYSIHTVNNYKKVVLEYLEFLDKECIDIKDANNLVVRNYLRSLDKHNYSNKTLCLYISSLRSFYKYLLKNRVIKSNPMVLIKNPKLEKRVPKFLYYNELSSLFESIDTRTVLGIRDNLILEILYSTGVRVSELVSIKLSDINNFDKSITIFGKGKKSRIVLFGDTLESALNLYLNKSRNILIKTNTDILLLNKNGTPLTDRGVRLIISKIVEKASIKQNVSPHVLRHTFATHLLKEGADLKTVQELLGHATLSATEVYTHVTNEGLRKTYLDCHPRGRK